MFKIIQEIKTVGFGGDKRKMLFVVPEAWESQNKLYWPTKYKNKIIETIRKDKFSIPCADWEIRPCTLKRSFLSTFEEAEGELQKMTCNYLTTFIILYYIICNKMMKQSFACLI